MLIILVRTLLKKIALTDRSNLNLLAKKNTKIKPHFPAKNYSPTLQSKKWIV